MFRTRKQKLITEIDALKAEVKLLNSRLKTIDAMLIDFCDTSLTQLYVAKELKENLQGLKKFLGIKKYNKTPEDKQVYEARGILPDMTRVLKYTYISAKALNKQRGK